MWSRKKYRRRHPCVSKAGETVEKGRRSSPMVSFCSRGPSRSFRNHAIHEGCLGFSTVSDDLVTSGRRKSLPTFGLWPMFPRAPKPQSVLLNNNMFFFFGSCLISLKNPTKAFKVPPLSEGIRIKMEQALLLCPPDALHEQPPRGDRKLKGGMACHERTRFRSGTDRLIDILLALAKESLQSCRLLGCRRIESTGLTVQSPEKDPLGIPFSLGSLNPLIERSFLS